MLTLDIAIITRNRAQVLDLSLGGIPGHQHLSSVKKNVDFLPYYDENILTRQGYRLIRMRTCVGRLKHASVQTSNSRKPGTRSVSRIWVLRAPNRTIAGRSSSR